jgi:oligopeptide transport system ATP-binding protein
MPLTRTPLMEVQGLCKLHARAHWWQRQCRVRALDNVDLALQAGKTLALVGESGSGKTTLAMCLAGLEQPDAGDIRFEGRSLLGLRRRERIAAGQEIQLIFQDSAGALSPRMSAIEIIEEPLLIRRQGSSKERALKIMEQVGFSAAWKTRRPNELSGGQRQRVAIARALVLKPKLLILDEALNGLDLSIQGQITNLLLDLQTTLGLSYLYISHNLELVPHIADEIAVIHEGRIVQTAKSPEAFTNIKSLHSQPTWSEELTERVALGAHTGA